jgi:cysteine-rich repeat protein
MKKQSLISLFLATLLLMSGFSFARAQGYPETSPGTPVLFGILDTSRGVLHTMSALFGLVVDPGAGKDLPDVLQQYVFKTFGPYDANDAKLAPLRASNPSNPDWDAAAYFTELFAVTVDGNDVATYDHQNIIDLALENAVGSMIINYGETAVNTIVNKNFTANTCGDGVLQEPREACEDGNTADGDGCSSICQFEAGYTPVCGDTILTAGEFCDGNKYTFCSADGNPGAQLLTCKADCSGFDPAGQCTSIHGVSKFLGVTIDAYEGNLGYNGANAICKAATAFGGAPEDQNAHVCSESELMDIYAAGKAYDENGNLVGISGLNGVIASRKGWIIAGRPISGGLSNPINDCGGFTQTGYFNYGRFWDFAPTVGQAWSRSCNIDPAGELALGFACCTY